MSTNEADIQQQPETIPQFATRLRSKYQGAYDEVPDGELVDRYLRKNPVYTDRVQLPDDFKLLRTTSGDPKLDSIYEQAGRENNLDPNLLLEQGRVESVNFNPKYIYQKGATSSKGAGGIGQFMPETAPSYGLKVSGGVDERYDPSKAIPAQARMMRELLDKHQGNTEAALAAYNSGSNLSTSSALSNRQRIPETRSYVDKITGAIKSLPVQLGGEDFTPQVKAETAPQEAAPEALPSQPFIAPNEQSNARRQQIRTAQPPGQAISNPDGTTTVRDAQGNIVGVGRQGRTPAIADDTPPVEHPAITPPLQTTPQPSVAAQPAVTTPSPTAMPQTAPQVAPQRRVRGRVPAQQSVQQVATAPNLPDAADLAANTVSGGTATAQSPVRPPQNVVVTVPAGIAGMPSQDEVSEAALSKLGFPGLQAAYQKKTGRRLETITFINQSAIQSGYDPKSDTYSFTLSPSVRDMDALNRARQMVAGTPSMSPTTPEENRQSIDQASIERQRSSQVRDLIDEQVNSELAAETGLTYAEAEARGFAPEYDARRTAWWNKYQDALSRHPELANSDPRDVLNEIYRQPIAGLGSPVVNAAQSAAQSAMLPVAEGVKGSVGSTISTLGKVGKLARIPGSEDVVQTGQRAAAGGQIRDLIDEPSAIGKFGRAAGRSAGALPLTIAKLETLGVPGMVVEGAASRADEGVGGMLKGAAESAATLYSMEATGHVLSPIMNALVWTAAPTAKGVLMDNQDLATALGENLTGGVLAGKMSADRISNALASKGYEPYQVKSDDGRTAEVYVNPQGEFYSSATQTAKADAPIIQVSNQKFGEMTQNGKNGQWAKGQVMTDDEMRAQAEKLNQGLNAPTRQGLSSIAEQMRAKGKEPLTPEEANAAPTVPPEQVSAEETPHYSNFQPRRSRNTESGNKGQFKSGKPELPEGEQNVELSDRTSGGAAIGTDLPPDAGEGGRRPVSQVEPLTEAPQNQAEIQSELNSLGDEAANLRHDVDAHRRTLESRSVAPEVREIISKDLATKEQRLTEVGERARWLNRTLREQAAPPPAAQNTDAVAPENLTRNFRAGTNDASMTFASPEQRDLYDYAANEKYKLRGGQNKTGQRTVKNADIGDVANRLGLSEAEARERAFQTYDDVKAQMKGVKHLEERKLVDNVMAATPADEGVKQVHDFSSTQVDLPPAVADKLRAASRRIPESEIYTDPKDPSFGREENPHITVKYGLHTNNADEVRRVLADEPPVKVKLGKTSIFAAKGETPYDVVKVDVDSPDLHRLNAKIAKALKVTDTHPEYKPHATLAYVKKGMGSKYVGNADLVGSEATLHSVTFSGKDGKTVEIPLGQSQGQDVAQGSKPQTEPERVEAFGTRHVQQSNSFIGNPETQRIIGDIENGNASIRAENRLKQIAKSAGLEDAHTDEVIKQAKAVAEQKSVSASDRPGAESSNRRAESSRTEPVSYMGSRRTAEPSATESTGAEPPTVSSAGTGDTRGNRPEDVTGGKVDVTRGEREARGLNAVERQAYLAAGDSYTAGKQEVEAGRIEPRGLAESVAENPRPLSAKETGALIYDRARLKNEQKAIYDDINKAVDAGDEKAVAQGRERLQQNEKAFDANDKALELGGREWSMAGQARKTLVKSDYSIAEMIQSYKAETGKEPSPRVRAQIETQSKRIAELEKQIAAHEEQGKQQSAQDGLNKIKDEIAREGRRTRRASTRADLDTEFAQLSTQFSKRLETRLHANPLDPELVKIIGKMAKNRVLAGVNTVEGLVDAVHAQVKDYLDDKRAIRDAISGYGRETQSKKVEEWQKTLNGLKSQMRDLSKQEDEASGIREKANLKAQKTRLQNSINEYERRIREGDFTPPPRRQVEHDRQSLDLLSQVGRIKEQYENLKQQEIRRQRPLQQKILDTAVKGRRAVALSSSWTLGKLTSAATQRLGITPVEEIEGGFMSALPGLKTIARQAPSEGGFRPSAEANAIARAWRTYLEAFKPEGEIRQALKTGKTSIDVLYGGKRELPPEALDFIGHLHSALKAPAKLAQWERSMAKNLDWLQRQGKDISDPAVREWAGARAYVDSNRAVLMQDNMLSDGFSQMLSYLNNKGALGRVTAAAGRLIFPVTKVAPNFVKETLNYTAGGVNAMTRMAAATKFFGGEGLKNLTPDQADGIMRAFKKQGLGVALFALGVLNRGNIGGYGKRKDEKDVQAGGMRIFGWDVPSWLLHTPPLEVMQMGATYGRTLDARGTKPEEAGLAAATLKTGVGLAREIPFFEEPMQAGSHLDNYKSASTFAGSMAGSMVTPPDVARAAKAFDPNEPTTTGRKIAQMAGVQPMDAVRRRPQNFGQAVEMGWPGARQNVPVNNLFGTERTPAAVESQRLNLNAGDSKQGEKESLETFQKRQQEVNPLVNSALDSLVRDHRYGQLSDEEKKQVFSDVVRRVRENDSTMRSKGEPLMNRGQLNREAPIDIIGKAFDALAEKRAKTPKINPFLGWPGRGQPVINRPTQ